MEKNASPGRKRASTRPSARISVIFARGSDRAVVFRRGPAKWTLVFLWDMETDEFFPGDWHWGRIYEDRCDLSPEGERLVYFANCYGHSSPDGFQCTWTAVSTPPSLAPGVAWPLGDTWAGGGCFDDDGSLWLEHRHDTRHPNYDSTDLVVRLGSPPISRVARDGWTITDNGLDATGFRQIRVRSLGRRNLELVSAFRSFAEPWQYEVKDHELVIRLDMDWADVDRQGRLIGSKDGCLHEITLKHDSYSCRMIADLNDFVPPKRRAPTWVRSPIDS